MWRRLDHFQPTSLLHNSTQCNRLGTASIEWVVFHSSVAMCNRGRRRQTRELEHSTGSIFRSRSASVLVSGGLSHTLHSPLIGFFSFETRDFGAQTWCKCLRVHHVNLLEAHYESSLLGSSLSLRDMWISSLLGRANRFRFPQIDDDIIWPTTKDCTLCSTVNCCDLCMLHWRLMRNKLLWNESDPNQTNSWRIATILNSSSWMCGGLTNDEQTYNAIRSEPRDEISVRCAQFAVCPIWDRKRLMGSQHMRGCIEQTVKARTRKHGRTRAEDEKAKW